MRAAFAGIPGTRIERILMRRGVENLAVILEAVLCSIAVVDVEIQDGDAADVLIPGSHDADRHVVEEAESHGSGALRVMAWRTHDGQSVLGAATEDPIDALNHRSGRRARSHHGL